MGQVMKTTSTTGKNHTLLSALKEIATNSPTEKISLDTFSAGLGLQSYGALLLTLNIPNLIPIPLPFLSVIFGIPLALVGLQIAAGIARPWIPAFLRKRGIRKSEIINMCDKVEKQYGWFQRLVHARLPFLTQPFAVRLIGLVIFILAGTMVLPIPFGNLVLAIPIAVLAVGLFSQDGLIILLGLLLGLFGLTFNLFIGSSILLSIWYTLTHFLS